jgi:hypothetical protein
LDLAVNRGCGNTPGAKMISDRLGYKSHLTGRSLSGRLLAVGTAHGGSPAEVVQSGARDREGFE